MNESIKNSKIGHEACAGEKGGAYTVLVGKHVRRNPLGRPRHR
jgi:hypothetical protein